MVVVGRMGGPILGNGMASHEWHELRNLFNIDYTDVLTDLLKGKFENG